MQEEAEVECPFCGESITILVDLSEAQQTYIEDCSVCCRPIQFQVTCDDGALLALDASRGS